MDIKLLEILACPICKGKLMHDKTSDELICRFDRMAYPVENEIPVLIVERARRVEL